VNIDRKTQRVETEHVVMGGVQLKVNLFIVIFKNKHCVRFGKGKVEVKSWRCMENLDR